MKKKYLASMFRKRQFQTIALAQFFLILFSFSVSATVVAAEKVLIKEFSIHNTFFIEQQSGNQQQETITVTGRVTDNSGVPLPGVNIYEKDTPSNGTISDDEGRFTLIVPVRDAVLVFRSIGYTSKEIPVDGRDAITVSLSEDITGLDEVVVIGYGTQKKSDITGSVASFNVSSLDQRPQTNIVQALQGTVAGLNVTSSASTAEDNAAVLIRGQNSITASNNPLIILDGIPYAGSLSALNTNDIASIEVLKDASATAIYGSRGANGVILVSTKLGEAGKPKFSYDVQYSWDEIAHLPDMQNASDFWRDYWERSVTNGLITPSNTNSVADQITQAFEGDETDNTDIEAYMMGYPGTTWSEHTAAILSGYPEYTNDYSVLQQIAADFAYPSGGRDTDWIELATRTGHKQKHNFSVSGGNDNARYFASANYTNVEGIAKGDDFKSYTYRINMNLKLTERISYGTNTQLGFYDRSGVPAEWGGNGAFLLSPTYNAFHEDGSIDLYPMDEETSIGNPLEFLLHDDQNKATSIITNHYLDIDIPGIEGLHYKLNTGYSYTNQRERNYQGRNTVAGLLLGGNLQTYDYNVINWTIENILSYTRTFDRHNIFLTALYSAQENSSESNRINGRGFDSDVMSYYQASNAEILTADSDYGKSNHLSQMFRANYGFDNRYLFTATVRRDGYSAFGNDTKFGLFPSIAFGWNIANEAFMKDAEKIEALKLRLSYGINGNEAVSNYATLPVMASMNYIDQFGNELFGYYPSQLANPDLSWESTRSLNMGFDFTLFKGRVRGSADAYRSNTYDLLLTETIAAINGTTSIIRNIGETKNHGMELQVSTINISKSHFSWRTDFNISSYNTEIVHVGLTDGDGNYIDDVASEWFIGYPVNVNFDYVLDRILQKEDFILDSNGDYVLNEFNDYQLREDIQDEVVVFGTPYPGKPVLKDLNDDGLIGGSEDKMIHGDRSPDLIAGMTNTVKYGNWTFSFFLNGVWGITQANVLINTKGLGPKRKMNLVYWTPDNPINELPGANRGSMTQEELVPYQKANFVRLQDVSLSYDFPAKMMSRIDVTDLSAFINVKNAATFTNWEGLDPEYSSQTSVPRARSYIVGLRLSF